MVLVPGDSLVLAPLTAASGVTKTGQEVKRDVERKLPPLPWDLKPTGLGVPSPGDVLAELESRVREVVSYPLRIIESGSLPPPHQVLRMVVTRKPLETVEEHVDTIPTPLQILKKFPPFKDLPTPRDFAADAERAMSDVHTLMQDQHQNIQENVPVMVENSKQAQTDLTALRHAGVELAQAGAKSLIKVSKSLSKLFEEFADGGLAGVLF